jgi:hypothetical protein
LPGQPSEGEIVPNKNARARGGLESEFSALSINTTVNYSEHRGLRGTFGLVEVDKNDHGSVTLKRP